MQTDIILHGDALTELSKLPDKCVHTVCTSPPYYGLRDYGLEGQIGLESSPELYVQGLVEIFRQVWRVLRDDGSLWLVLGDSYAGSWGNYHPNSPPGKHGQRLKQTARWNRPTFSSQDFLPPTANVASLKIKDLIGIPWRVALALQADGCADLKAIGLIERIRGEILEAYCEYVPDRVLGVLKQLDEEYHQAKGNSWWLRSDIIWAKPGPMPSSVGDRPTSSHEHIFLLTKSGTATYWTHRDLSGVRIRPKPDYRWLDRENSNAETANEPSSWRAELLADGETKRWQRINLWCSHGYFYDGDAIKEPVVRPDDRLCVFNPYGADPHHRIKTYGKHSKTDSQSAGRRIVENVKRARALGAGHESPFGMKRNKRDVWWITTKPFPDAHYAVYPPELIRPCILAGTSERGCCPTCGAPWEGIREVKDTGETQKMPDGWDTDEGQHGAFHRKGRQQGQRKPITQKVLTAWRPTCPCGGDPVPCIVLDPFMGSGTTGLVARQEGRHYLGIELDPEWAKKAQERIWSECPMERLR